MDKHEGSSTVLYAEHRCHLTPSCQLCVLHEQVKVV